MEQEYIDTALAKYNLPDAKIAELKAQYLPIVVSGVDDVENYEACKEGHIQIKKLRGKIEECRKDLKADSLAYGRMVDTEAKRLTAGVKEIEDHLYDQRKVVEDAKRVEQEAKEQAARDEAARLEQEEKDRLAKQKEEQDKKDAEQQAAQDKLDEERRQFEEDKRRDRETKEKEEQDKKDAEEATAREEQEAKDAKVRAEKEAARKKQEEEDNAELARIEEERQEALKPDKEKLGVLFVALMEIKYPDMATPEGKEFVEYIKTEVSQVAKKVSGVNL